MSRYQYHRSRNEKSHTRRDSHHEKKSVTTKNLAATLGMMGLAIGATLLVEGGPWKSRMAAAATVVGMEQVLERVGFFDGKVRERGKGDGREGMGVDGEDGEDGEDVDRRDRRDRGEREREGRDVRGLNSERRRRDMDDDDDEWKYQDQRKREAESRRETRGMGHDSHDRTRRHTHTHDDDRTHHERRARRREANRRFDEEYEIEEVPA
ncbi:hypothetical protein SBOR_3947 [Sclerotinia borealis F-4128]|uniref:Uncharacterized protein n=1 Tax=Sclerotinia borealis (strain F-4128) TaxID=1432307 RepID=W9CIE2_SCLBF|nr:hypothetical protein SBOR_3947 [Sclerotinia borealis F-4128]